MSREIVYDLAPHSGRPMSTKAVSLIILGFLLASLLVSGLGIGIAYWTMKKKPLISVSTPAMSIPATTTSIGGSGTNYKVGSAPGTVGGAGSGSSPAPSTGTVGGTKTVLPQSKPKLPLPREDFKKLVIGKSQEEVKALFGAPSYTYTAQVDQGLKLWTYYDIILDPDNGKATNIGVQLRLRDGVWVCDMVR